MWRRTQSAVIVTLSTLLLGCFARAQHPDPAWNPAILTDPKHTPLAEEYIWTANDAAVLRADHAKFNYKTTEKKIEPHFFRASFEVHTLPDDATLYVAGPRSVQVWINGIPVLQPAADATSPLATHVYSAAARAALHTGRNTIALQAVRGRGIVAASDIRDLQQIAFGESLVVKIVPRAPDQEAPPLLLSNSSWRSTTTEAVDWQQAAFDDSQWPAVTSLGGIESRAIFYQWNLDAGLYNWPGYLGISPELRTYTLAPVAVTHPVSQQDADTIHPTTNWVLVDFGREVAGRLLLRAQPSSSVRILVSYGESKQEAMSGQNYLGNFTLQVGADTAARGPKSGFRYAWLRFPEGKSETSLASIQVEGIAYPVNYKGSFRSSDEMLNRIWEAGAYTAHLCMQDGVWDAAKRDRGWWAGDLDVAGPTIANVFADSALLNFTFEKLIPAQGEHVNGIPSYSALWLSALADLYRRTGDAALLSGKEKAVRALLARMDEEFDSEGKFLNHGHHWLFVDWSHELYAFTPEAELGTALAMVRGFNDGAWLLETMGDHQTANHFSMRAHELANALRSRSLGQAEPYGERWQLNAMAVLARVAQPAEYESIWRNSLGHADAHTQQTISPYFNAYVLDAMARMNRRTEAVNWLRTYWGGMLDEGATTLWEAYDLHWPKDEPHKYLEADGRVGYFVSLAHAWSAGPTAWMMDELLGIQPITPGYGKARIRPDLAGLQWIEGTMPTPHGPIHLAMHSEDRFEVDLPSGIEAEVLVPSTTHTTVIQVNHTASISEPAENGSRRSILLQGPGHFLIERR